MDRSRSALAAVGVGVDLNAWYRCLCLTSDSVSRHLRLQETSSHMLLIMPISIMSLQSDIYNAIFIAIYFVAHAYFILSSPAYGSP